MTSYTIHVNDDLWIRFKMIMPKSKTINGFIEQMIEEKVESTAAGMGDQTLPVTELRSRMEQMEATHLKLLQLVESTANIAATLQRTEPVAEEKAVTEEQGCSSCGQEGHKSVRSRLCPNNKANKTEAKAVKANGKEKAPKASRAKKGNKKTSSKKKVSAQVPSDF